MTNNIDNSFWKRSLKAFRQKISLHRAAARKEKRRARVPALIRLNSEKGIFPVEIRNPIGIGAKLIWCLEILLYCQERGLQPFFRFTYDNPEPEDDFYADFFESKNLPMSGEWITINAIGDLGLPKNYNQLLTIDVAHDLFTRNIIPKADVREEVDMFVKSELSEKPTLGLHYRNTDKGSEAPHVDYETVLDSVYKVLRENPHLEKIFLTSDDQRFVEFMQGSVLAGKIVIRKDSFRSDDGKAIHVNNELDKKSINRDAVVNMLILTRCSFILKTSSILSSCSLICKPSIPYRMLNQPYDNKLWFPESALVKSQS